MVLDVVLVNKLVGRVVDPLLPPALAVLSFHGLVGRLRVRTGRSLVRGEVHLRPDTRKQRDEHAWSR